MTYHAELVTRLRALVNDKALSIGDAWNALEEAADAIEMLRSHVRSQMDIMLAHLARACALTAYSEHRLGCPQHPLEPRTQPCTCGLTELLESWPKGEVNP